VPIVDVSWRDLEKLVGRKLSWEELEECLAKLKCEVEEVEGDIVWYEATHDRPDLFSAEGLARALKGLLEVELGLREFRVSRDERVDLYIEGPSYRPYALGAVVRNLRLDDEAVRQLMNLQEKLHVTYCRDRRKVSIGLYDLDAVRPPIFYRSVEPEGVRFVPLDEEEAMTPAEVIRRTEKGRAYGHLISGYPEYPILVDSEGTVLSLPPIINSEETRVTEETRNVFIDVTGTDPALMMKVLTVVATSVAERGAPEELVLVNVHTGGKVVVSPDLGVEEREVAREDVARLSGVELGCEEIAHCLMMMRHGAQALGDKVRAEVAPYRVDILHTVDLVEDVLMAYGYDRIAPEPLPPTHAGRISPEEYISRKVRDIMVGLGFQEVANYMMSCPDVLVRRMRLEGVELVEVENPKMERYTALRQWLLPGLLSVVSFNKHLGFPLRVFEVGDVAIVDPSSDVGARIERHAACVIAGPEVTMTDGLVTCKALMRSLGLTYSLRERSHPSFIEGRCADVLVGSRVVGLVGEFHPEVLSNFDIPVPAAGLELDLRALLSELTSRS